MSRSTTHGSSFAAPASRRPANLTRRQLLAGAGAGAAAFLLDRDTLQAQAPPARTVVFAHTTVINVDAVLNDVALAINGDRIAAIGPTDAMLQTYPNADVYDGRGKALLPGLINCHAHMAAVLARGFNEDFGFPNSAHLAVQPASLLRGEEETLMVTVAALEAIRTGTTTIVENVGEHRPLGRGIGAVGPALRVRRVGPRQRERGGADVARWPFPQSNAQVLSQAA